jgi:tripartite-type tricarboxylate transporter receptor subunit TctC
MKKTNVLYSWLAAAAIAASAVFPVTVSAADPFPNRPVQVIVPFAPGDTDSMVRPFTERMGEFLGQPVVLNYKPGAGGGVGAGMVATSAPDGHTLVATSQGSLVVVPLANKNIKYTTESFAPVAALSEGAFLIVVNSKSPWQSLKELIEYSKESPGKLNYSSSGAMGVTHLLAEIFSKEAGVKWTHVPHQGSGPAITALLGDHVEMASTAIGPAQAHIQSGALRALAVFSDTRLKAFPDIPTLKELGYAIASPVLYGISAPAGTPKEIVDALYQAARKAVEKHEEAIAANLATLGAQIKLLGPDEYSAYLQDQKKLFSAGIKTLD